MDINNIKMKQYLFQRGGTYNFLDSNHRKAANKQRQMKHLTQYQLPTLLKFASKSLSTEDWEWDGQSKQHKWDTC